MLLPEKPAHEAERLRALYSLEILDTNPEKDFDEIAEIAAAICGLDQAQITLIDRDRQWIKAELKPGNQNLSRDLAFCSHTILGSELFLVENAAADHRFSDHPLVVKENGIRFYAGMPLTTSTGYNIGALCVLDSEPRTLDLPQKRSLEILAKRVVREMELKHLAKLNAQQKEELLKQNEMIRYIISIIGHDVRGPLQNIAALIHLFSSGSLSVDEITNINQKLSRTLGVTENLIKNMMHWASTINHHQQTDEYIDFNALAREVADQLTWEVKEKNNILVIEPETNSFTFDKNVLQFVIRNLVHNANKYTEKGTIKISCKKNGTHIKLAVSDTGSGIPENQIQEIFQWKKRQQTEGTQHEKGSGLALLLMHDLLKKKGAAIGVYNNPDSGCTFEVSWPVERLLSE